MLKKSRHTPAHLLLDDMPYFITGAIYQKRPLLIEATLKWQLLTLIKKNLQTAEWQLKDYVMLDNHYPLLVISKKGEDLPKIIKKIHGASAHIIRLQTRCERPVWWNYWDYCPRNEKDYYTKLNYLLTNPIKHGYVDDLNDYPFSSFSARLTKRGREAMIQQFRCYANYSAVTTIYDDF
jgi:putative transposase